MTPVDEPVYPYTLEFYEDPQTGAEPVLEWMRELEPYLKRATGVALREVLQRLGTEVCKGEWGKPLGEGLFEFRVRHGADEIIRRFTEQTPRPEPARKVALRVFFHVHGDKLVLLLGGYDKAADPSDKRQDEEIATARRRLAEYRRRPRT